MKMNYNVLFSLFIGFISPNVFAGISNVLIDDLSHCMKVSSDEERLVCFDQLAKRNVTQLNKIKVTEKPVVELKPIQLVETKKTTQIKLVETKETAKIKPEEVKELTQVKLKKAKDIDKFSNESLIKTQAEKGPDSITATISNLKKLLRGQWVIYFENGQKWQQKDIATVKLKVGDSVRLKKGSMGAVYLFKENSNRKIRVKRLK
jgi:hypothetical protein